MQKGKDLKGGRRRFMEEEEGIEIDRE
jgi:hypothetical protein